MTTDSHSKQAIINATQSETDVRRANGDAGGRVNGNGHEALDLAETVSPLVLPGTESWY
jgi:hypothetical protein